MPEGEERFKPMLPPPPGLRPVGPQTNRILAGQSPLAIEPVIDEGARKLAADLEAGAPLEGSDKLFVHRKAILAVMASNRNLTARNAELQAGLDQAAEVNNGLEHFLCAAMDMLREQNVWTHEGTTARVGERVAMMLEAEAKAEQIDNAVDFPASEGPEK